MSDDIQPDGTTRRRILLSAGGFALAGLGSGAASAGNGGKGKGTIPEPPRYSDGGLGNLVLAATGNSSTEETVNPFRNYDDSRDYVYVPPDAFDVDFGAGTATVDFEDNTADERLHLAVFKTPGPLRPNEGFPEIEFQELYDEAYTRAGSGSMTVDLPTPDDFS